MSETVSNTLWGIKQYIVNSFLFNTVSYKHNNRGTGEGDGTGVFVPLWNGDCKDWVTEGVGGREGGADPGRIQKIVKHTTWNTILEREKTRQRTRNADLS